MTEHYRCAFCATGSIHPCPKAPDLCNVCDVCGKRERLVMRAGETMPLPPCTAEAQPCEEAPSRILREVQDTLDDLHAAGIIEQTSLAHLIPQRLELSAADMEHTMARTKEILTVAGEPYHITYEHTPHAVGGTVAELPGCIATARTREEVRDLLKEAIAMHLEGLREDEAATEGGVDAPPGLETDDKCQRTTQRQAQQMETGVRIGSSGPGFEAISEEPQETQASTDIDEGRHTHLQG